MRIVRLMAIISGLAGVACGLPWVWVTHRVMTVGKIILVEPVDWIIRAEFGLSLFFLLIFMATIIIAIRRG